MLAWMTGLYHRQHSVENQIWRSGFWPFELFVWQATTRDIRTKKVYMPHSAGTYGWG
ncbi:hypothetical protein PS689_00719 [Pseudomonas fluorescens]|nr:hypothetical protein ALQ85_200075 [Pseudomonas syringae]VVN75733.1 hypothetical protein PS689_00719 [Pseudomonas fluorescens]